MLPNVEKWVKECVPTETFSLRHPKRTGQAIAQECVKYLQTKIETDFTMWCRTGLMPSFIMPRLKTLTEQQETNISAYESDLARVRATLSLHVDTPNTGVSAWSRLAASIAGFMVGGAGGAIGGGLLGWENMMPSIIANLVTVIAFAIASFFTPIGMPVFIIALIGSSIVGTAKGVTNMKDKKKKKLATGLKEELLKQQESLTDGIVKNIQSTMDKMAEDIRQGIYKPVNDCQTLLDNTRQSANASAADIERQLQTKQQLLKESTQLGEDLDNFYNKM